MLYWLSQLILQQTAGTELGAQLSPLRLFRYITFRAAGAAIMALLLSLWLGPKVIGWLKRFKISQDYPDPAGAYLEVDRRRDKRGVPTMGGLLIVLAIDATVLVWARLNPLVTLSLCSLVGLAGLGFLDDWAKLTRASSRGATALMKLSVQTALAVAIVLYLWAVPGTHKLISDVMVPFVKYPVLTEATGLGITLAVLAIVGSSNAVNLTDGMDGLAIGCVVIVTVVFLVLTYVAGNFRFATYLQVPYVPGAGELTVVCAAIFGAGLGFLYFNCNPAEVFMGDSGSLALGGVLGIIAVMIHQPFALVIAGGVFVLEAASVLLQITVCQFNKRFRGVDRRPLLMSPLHYHFLRKGWDENKIVMRFFIIGILCAVMALATLKVR
jgi:phospho-N-acetylmuramoyl-pentapeptide-transferase